MIMLCSLYLTTESSYEFYKFQKLYFAQDWAEHHIDYVHVGQKLNF